jgi:hypothetical protein
LGTSQFSLFLGLSTFQLMPVYVLLSACSVTEAEAQKWEEHREEREQRAAQLKQRLLEQYRQRGQAPPEALVTDSS